MKKLLLILALLATVLLVSACSFTLTPPALPPGEDPEEFTVYSPDVKVSLVLGSLDATEDEISGYYALRSAIAMLLPNGYLVKTDDYDRSATNPSEIVVGHSRREISSLAYEYLESKGTLDDGYSHFVIYCHDGAVAIAGDGQYAMDAAISYFLNIFVNGKTTLVLDYDLVEYVSFTVASHEAMLNDQIDAEEAEWFALRWQELSDRIGASAAAAVKELYDYYGSEWLTWLGNLFDAETGCFYYSNSGRDTDGVYYAGNATGNVNMYLELLPDAESTCQALDMLQELGLFRRFGDSWMGALPEEMQRRCLAYIQAMQSEEDGYFYHPQWNHLKISDTRRGRDYSQCLLIIKKFGGTPLYTPANERIESGASSVSAVIAAFMETDEHKSTVTLTNSSLPAHLQTEEALIAYIDNLMSRNSCHGVGHILSSQASQILAAGLAEECVAYIDTFQNPETGFFYNRRYDEHEYDKISAIIKMSSLYGVLGARLKYMDKIIDSAIATILSDYKPSDHNICFIFNSWGGLGAAINNVALTNDPDANDNTNVDVVRQKVYDRLPEMIDATIAKLQDFRKADGSFSFKPSGSSHIMEGFPVAVANMNEGDVNGTTVAIYYTINGLFSCLGVSDIPLLTYKDYRDFVAIINAALAEEAN